MYVCLCRAVTLTRLRAVVADGATSVDAVEKACGAGGDCGTCRREIADVLRERSPGGRADSEAA
jgi:bacterioferritin-associated ferredoxin